MPAVFLLALLAPVASIKLTTHAVNDAHPRYALVGLKEDIEVAWQRPKGETVGAFLWLHGCGNRALDMWTSKGHDGWEFKECNNTKKGVCAGLPQHAQMKSIARKRGYIVIAVQGGATSNRGCFHPEDVPRIKEAIKHVYTVEKLGTMPLIMTGMSAGGRVIADLAGSAGGAGVPMKCGAVLVAEINNKAVWKFPKNVPLGFWHMPKDGETEKMIGQNMRDLKGKCAVKQYRKLAGKTEESLVSIPKNLKKAKCIVEDHEIDEHLIDEEFLMAGGYGLNPETATKTMEAFKKAGLLKENGHLKMDPYNPKPKTRWMKAVEAAGGDLRGEVGGFGQQAPLTKLMERSWATHALAADKTGQIIDFCEKKEAQHFAGV